MRGRVFVAGLAGAVFGLGLVVSGMTDPMKVLGFFDVFGAWDPSLAFVMGGAVPVMAAAWIAARRRRAPIFGGAMPEPAPRAIDARLVGGSAGFGLGWGLTGLCPAPGVALLASGAPEAVAFVAALALGLIGPDLLERGGGARRALVRAWA